MRFVQMAASAEKVRGGVHAATDTAPRWPSSEAWIEARALAGAHRGRLLLGLALTIVSRAATLVLPASTKWFVDGVVGQQRWDLLPWLAAAVGVATAIASATSFLLSQILGVAAQRVITDIRMEVHALVIRLPVRHFDTTKTGALVSRIMNDADGIRVLVGNGLVQLMGSVVMALLALAVLFYLNWALTLVMLFVLTIFGGGVAWTVTRLRPTFRQRGQIVAEMTGRLNESLAGIRIIKAYAAEPRERAAFAADAERLFRNVAATLTAMSAATAFSTAILGAAAIVIILFGGSAIRQGAMTVGDMAMYVSFLAVLTLPIVQLASVGTQLSEAFASLDRLREMRRLPTEDADDADRMALPAVRGEIEFQDVSFGYGAGAPVLKQISFRAPIGLTTALVGSSGAGKSTLIGLIMAFSRPTSGRVLVDGRDLAAVRVSDFRRFLGVVLQDDVLFDGTIADAIAYGSAEASREQILAAGRSAHCDEFVRTFQHGYDTVIGERGVRLSGGQRQRVAIARALLADPRILILDEATSSLDSESEALIQDALAVLRRGRTTFVIAHRLSTVQSADQILVLERGEIVERGTHLELLSAGGRYRQLYDSQFRFEERPVEVMSGSAAGLQGPR
jgi:ABC-type multidrug transport system fused ATPase/permease subunit